MIGEKVVICMYSKNVIDLDATLLSLTKEGGFVMHIDPFARA